MIQFLSKAVITHAIVDLVKETFKYVTEEMFEDKKVPDRTVLDEDTKELIRKEYLLGKFKTQQEFTDYINNKIGINKSRTSIMRIVRNK